MPSPGSFLVCPFFAGTPRGASTEGLLVGIYQLAYQQAKAALSPPWHERYFMMTAWFNQYYPEIVDDLQAEPIKDFPMEWPADMLAPAHSKNDEPGMVLCDKHGYYWWEDGCIACQNGD